MCSWDNYSSFDSFNTSNSFASDGFSSFSPASFGSYNNSGRSGYNQSGSSSCSRGYTSFETIEPPQEGEKPKWYQNNFMVQVIEKKKWTSKTTGKECQNATVMDLYPIQNDHKTQSLLCLLLFAESTPQRLLRWLDHCETGHAILLKNVTVLRSNSQASEKGEKRKDFVPSYFAKFTIMFGQKSSAELITDSSHVVKPATLSEVFKYIKYQFDPIANLPKLHNMYMYRSYTIIGRVIFVGELEEPTETRSLHRRSIVVFDHSGSRGASVNCYLYGTLASSFACLTVDDEGVGDVIVLFNCSINSSDDFGGSGGRQSSSSAIQSGGYTGQKQQQQTTNICVFAYQGKAQIIIMLKHPAKRLPNDDQENLRKKLATNVIPDHVSSAMTSLLQFDGNRDDLRNISGFDLNVKSKVISNLREYSYLGTRGGYHGGGNQSIDTSEGPQKLKRVVENVILLSVDLSNFFTMMCTIPGCSNSVQHQIIDPHSRNRPYCYSSEDPHHCPYPKIKIQIKALLKHPKSAKLGEVQDFYLSWDYVYSRIKHNSAQFCFISPEQKRSLLVDNIPFGVPVDAAMDIRLYESSEYNGRSSTTKYGLITNLIERTTSQ